MLKILKQSATQCSKRGLFCSTVKADAAYEGPGKTTVNILNENRDKIMVDGLSRIGFTLNNGMKTIGPIAVFPDAVFQWNIKSTLSVTEDAFALFELLDPKPEIVFFGFGAADKRFKTNARTQFDKDYTKQRSQMIGKIMMAMRKRKVNIEAMPTEDAIGAYNYLVEEDRLVAAALIPPEEVTILHGSDTNIDNLLLDRGVDFGDKIAGTSPVGFDHQEAEDLRSELGDFQQWAKDPKAYRQSKKNMEDFKDGMK